MSSFLGSLLSKSHARNYQLLRAKSINQAINAIAKGACDVVLMNYYWGRERIGERLLRWAKIKKPQIPMIVITKTLDPEIDRVVIKMGATDYLTANNLNPNALDHALRYAIERRSNFDHINYLIHHDHLTNLPNRVLFRQRLKHSIRLSDRESDQFVLMIIDINNFKEVNNLYGHDVGDEFLKAFAENLIKISGRKSNVSRIAGDEFAIILRDIGKIERVQILAEKLISEACSKIKINDNIIIAHISIGMAIYPNTGSNENQLQRNASLAMKQAKQEVISSYQFYSDDTEKLDTAYNSLQQQFINALATNEIGLYFNPRIDCGTEQIVGIEVNPYWSHPEKGLLEYEQFIWNGLDKDVAGRFTEWLLATSFEYFKKLKVSSSTKLIFNVEFQGLSSVGFPEIVEKHLATYSISGNQLEFDLSKVNSSQHNNLLEGCMRRLQSQGVTFGVNHFGSEEQSLSYIKTLPISIFKLNKEFVEEISHDDYDTLMSKALVDLAHSLGKQVVIEGLHSQLPINNIKMLGFDYYKSVFSVDALSLVKLQDVIDSPYLGYKTKKDAKLIDPKT